MALINSESIFKLNETNSFQIYLGDDYGTKKGSYGYTDAYGIYRKVDYIADSYDNWSFPSLNDFFIEICYWFFLFFQTIRFRATVSSNEPGTAPQGNIAFQIVIVIWS